MQILVLTILKRRCLLKKRATEITFQIDKYQIQKFAYEHKWITNYTIQFIVFSFLVVYFAVLWNIIFFFFFLLFLGQKSCSFWYLLEFAANMWITFNMLVFKQSYIISNAQSTIIYQKRYANAIKVLPNYLLFRTQNNCNRFFFFSFQMFAFDNLKSLAN